MPLPIGPFLSYDPFNFEITDGTDLGLTLTKIGQIMTLHNLSNGVGLTLGNGTFFGQIIGIEPIASYFSKTITVMWQGTNIRTNTPPITPSNYASIWDYLNTDFGTSSLYGWIMKISNDTSGGVDGSGTYGKFRQPF
jgi:hypothetical protein